jgi:hypothetical protein
VIFLDTAGNVEELVALGHTTADPEVLLGVVMTINNCSNTGITKLADPTVGALLRKTVTESDDPDITREAQQALAILFPAQCKKE